MAFPHPHSLSISTLFLLAFVAFSVFYSVHCSDTEDHNTNPIYARPKPTYPRPKSLHSPQNHPYVASKIIINEYEDWKKGKSTIMSKSISKEREGWINEGISRFMDTDNLWVAMEDFVAFHSATYDQDNPKNMMQDRKGGGWLWYYLPNPTQVDGPCRRDVLTLLAALTHRQPWALAVVDSWGKVPDGLFGGNYWVGGAFDECLAIAPPYKDNNATFLSQYCSLSLRYLPKNNTADLYDGNEKMTWREQEGGWRRSVDGEKEREGAPRLSSILGSVGAVMPYSWYGTCIPSSCSTEQFKMSIEHTLSNQGLGVLFTECQSEQHTTASSASDAFTAGDITLFVVLSVLVVTAVVAAGVDVWLYYSGSLQHHNKGYVRYLLPFSLYTNLEKLFTIRTDQGRGVITSLYGMRVLSMTWVVWGHQYIMTFLPSANKAIFWERGFKNPWLNQVLFNALPSVDTFFFMSGLLVAYGLTKEFEKTQKFNAPYYYIHRFIRLSPPILLLSGFLSVMPPYMVDGPLAPFVDAPHSLVDNCKRFWWRDALFISNFFFYNEDVQSCLSVCWYTAVDFQLYLVTPLILLPLLYKPKIGQLWLGCVTLASVVIPGVIIAVNQLPPNQCQDVASDKNYDYTRLVYTKPWGRASAYLAGIWLAVVLRQYKDPKLPKWAACVGWAVAVVLGLWVLFGVKDYNTLSLIPHPYDPAVSILYGSLHRLAWGGALAWVVFACHHGYGGPVNSFLGHPIWQPLSRLTYTIFLIAIPVQWLYYLNSYHVALYFSHLNKVLETVGVLFVSGGAAVCLSLLTEAPVLGLEKVLLKRV